MLHTLCEHPVFAYIFGTPYTNTLYMCVAFHLFFRYLRKLLKTRRYFFSWLCVVATVADMLINYPESAFNKFFRTLILLNSKTFQKRECWGCTDVHCLVENVTYVTWMRVCNCCTPSPYSGGSFWTTSRTRGNGRSRYCVMNSTGSSSVPRLGSPPAPPS